MRNFIQGGLRVAATRISIALFCIMLSILAGVYSLNLERSRAEDAFRNLAIESLLALKANMSAYVRVLDSGAAFISASDHVTLQDWITFTETLRLKDILPGINGIGYIVPVDRDKVSDFIASAAEDGVRDFSIHPDTTKGQLYVIKYIEPVDVNREVVGLNIAFETGRRTAANLSRDTGIPQLTKSISLVQDNTRQPGFLLLRPHYRVDAPLETVAQRRDALLGWVYTPFVGANILNGLTPNQSINLEISVYEGDVASEEALIFESAPQDLGKVRFNYTEAVEVFGQTWLIQWTSTPTFEGTHKSISPVIMLLSGMALTLAVIGFVNMSSRREKFISDQVAFKTRELVSLQDEARSVWENAVVPILVLNDKGEVISDNPAARDLLGRDGTERHKLITDRLSAWMHKAGAGSNRSILTVTLDNEILMLDIQCNRWTAPNGHGRTTVILQNVTDERQATQRVEETEQRWSLALEGAKIGVFDINLLTNKSIVSQTWRNLMRVPVGMSEDPQSHFLTRIHPDDLPVLQANDAACIRGETNRSVTEYRVKFDEEEWRWMRSDAVIVAWDEHGTATRMIGAQTDITDIRRARAALEASRSQFELLLKNAPVGMAILDKDGVFVGLNEAMCKLVGYSEEELLKVHRFADLLSQEDMLHILKSIGDKSPNRAQAYHGEHLIQSRDGREIWGLLSISWSFDPFEKRDIYIAQVQDISEKKNIEKLKNSFVATVSHELRTPLTSIKGSLGLLKAKVDDGDTSTHKRLVQIANSNADRLVELVNNILDFENIMAGEQQFDFAELNLQSEIGEAVRLIQPFANMHSAEISVDLPETPITVTADQSRLAQVLSNLLSNACKFSADKGIVEVKAEIVKDQAVVYVRDNGKGVPSSFRPNIFRPFSQADETDTRAADGTGLGLSISREIVARMGGMIDYECPREGLTIFWFSLPAISNASSALRLVEGEKQEFEDFKLRIAKTFMA